MVDRFGFKVLGTETQSTYPEQLCSLSVMLNIVSTGLHLFVLNTYCLTVCIGAEYSLSLE